MRGYALPKVASLGENLKRIRGDEDQKIVAKRMGVAQTRLSNWEKNRYKTVSVRTLLWLAKAYRCRVEDLVEGLDAEYDAGRDLSRHAVEYKSAPSQEVADVPASARVRELQDRLAHYDQLVPEIETILGKLVRLAAGPKVRPARGHASERGRRDRKAG